MAEDSFSISRALAWADNPKGKLKIGCYTVRVEGDDVQIEVPDPSSSEAMS